MTQTQTVYQRTPNGEKFAQKAAYKMIIYWLDGNVRTFHSREWSAGRRKMTDEAALSLLRKYAYNNKSKIQIALIYDNQTGQEIYKFKEGRWS